ncbi:sigma 54-interacting transcriptional regulator [Ferrovum sp.]|uniref:TraG/VirB4 family ATPase n=1 Tax=Ferrovum sp. TaxID=2609467 RepID=UPI0026323A54|nr:sigma 54-interacting transcriptional regulator [Ferrovum sp.]
MTNIKSTEKIAPEQFCYWLQGVFEVAGPASLNEDQVKIIREHLALVFDKQTPDHLPERPCRAEQTGAFIIGKAGTGKTTIAREIVGENLRNGKTVIILDCGSSYDELVQEVGGQFQSWDALGNVLVGGLRSTPESNGSTPLFVFDFVDVPHGKTAKIPLFFRSSIGENTFVLVDESERVSEKFPELKTLIHQWVERGASFCIIGQGGLCLQAFAGLPIKETLVTYCPAQQIRTPDGVKEWNYQILQPMLQPGGLVC